MSTDNLVMRQFRAQLLIVLCFLLMSVICVSAQQATPNPIFVPLNSSPTLVEENYLTETPSTEFHDDDPQILEDTKEPESQDIVERIEHHVLKRPIELASDKVHWVDRTYPYGSTQWGTREVHLGVEFVNTRFTPVYAVDAGTVIFSGSDSEFSVGPYEDYYGNVIIIAHDTVSLDGEPIFSLYGHLDRVEVFEGQQVDRGERIGRIGSSGIAIGAHLHFEIRVEDPFDYRFTRNPELWLQNYVDHGQVAGFIQNRVGEPIYGQRLVVRSDDVNREVFTYGSDRVNSDPVWQENFIVGDLPEGNYEIVILNDSGLVVYRETVSVESYKITFVDIVLDQ